MNEVPSNANNIYDLRDAMGNELYERIQAHPQKGQWQEGYAATGLMLNSVGHPDGKQALSMLVEDVERAHKRGVPIDIIKFALGQVVEWRKIILKAQGRGDGEIVVGEITMKILEENLHDKLPNDYLKELFS